MTLEKWLVVIQREQCSRTSRPMSARSRPTRRRCFRARPTIFDMCIRPRSTSAFARAVIVPYVADTMPFAPSLQCG